MEIKIKLFASLQTGRFKIKTIEYEDDATVGEIVKKLDIRDDESLIIFVNGRHSDKTRRLNNEDTLALFPPVGGG